MKLRTSKPENYPQPTAEEKVQKQIALAERIASLKAARSELAGPAALACQLEVERLSRELNDAYSG